MRTPTYRAAIGGTVVTFLAIASVALAADDKSRAGPAGPRAQIEIPASVSVPPLNLSDADRAKIRQAVSQEDTEVTFQLKATKSAQSFEPSVGARIPASLKLHALPRPLIYELPILKRYTYLKFKHQVLIVNPMTRKVTDMFPEASS